MNTKNSHFELVVFFWEKCLLQVHIAKEESKTGFSEAELLEIFENNELDTLKSIKVVGLMGMSTFTEVQEIVQSEFS